MSKRVPQRIGTGVAEVFVDTSGFFALLSAEDAAHVRARDWMASLVRARRRAVTTDHVVDETFTLLKARGLAHCCPAFDRILSTTLTLRVRWTESDIFSAATALFLNRLDQGFSLTDCVSFTVMEREDLHEALTTDHHFRIAGFTPLL